MDILLQYLNIEKQRQEYIKVKDVPCNSLYQVICPALRINMADRALVFRDYMEQTYKSNYLLAGVINARYCNRVARCGIVTGKPDRKSTRLNSSHSAKSRMPSSA